MRRNLTVGGFSRGLDQGFANKQSKHLQTKLPTKVVLYLSSQITTLGAGLRTDGSNRTINARVGRGL